VEISGRWQCASRTTRTGGRVFLLRERKRRARRHRDCRFACWG